MSIEYTILGLLNWRTFSGYDLKKIIAESDVFYWSGNNNQIYKSLIALHREGLVAQEVLPQENLPAKKLYSITEQGKSALRQWVVSTPALPEFRSTFLVQLAWAEMLSAEELDALLEAYGKEIDLHIRMLEAHAKSLAEDAPNRTARERYLWEQINEHYASLYHNEREWSRRLRAETLRRFSSQQGGTE